MTCDVLTIQSVLGGAPSAIDFDGKPHRFPIDRSKDAGWYIARLIDGFPVLNCGDWRSGEKFKFFGDEQERHTAQPNQARQHRERQQRATQANRTAKLATDLWNDAPPATEHPYLERKSIPPGNLRLLTPALIGTQQNLSLIHI